MQRTDRLVRAAVVALAVSAGIGGGAGAAYADHPCPMEPATSSQLRARESELLGLVNDERASRGLRRISVHSKILKIARDHAKRMAEEGRVYHNDDYQASRVGMEATGEVPANGCSVHAIHELVLGSPADRGTMLVEEWAVGGVGMASDEGGMLYAVEAYAQPKTKTAEPTPAAKAPAPPPAPVRTPSATAAGSVPEPAPARPEVEPATPRPAPQREVAVGEVRFEPVEEEASGPAASKGAGPGERSQWSTPLVAAVLLLIWGLLQVVFFPRPATVRSAGEGPPPPRAARSRRGSSRATRPPSARAAGSAAPRPRRTAPPPGCPSP